MSVCFYRSGSNYQNLDPLYYCLYRRVEFLTSGRVNNGDQASELSKLMSLFTVVSLVVFSFIDSQSS